MAITRADALTGTVKKQEYFSDFLNNFDKTPVGNQLGKVSNEKAVNQSLRNIIKTDLGERFFQPLTGGNIKQHLFDMHVPVIPSLIETQLEATIKKSEKRVNLLSIVVTSLPDTHELNINITYSLINDSTPITLSVILKRVR